MNQYLGKGSLGLLFSARNLQTLGFISPEVFIPMAERKGLIVNLGNIVFEKYASFLRMRSYGNME